MSKTVFISHSTADDSHVDRIVTALQDAGYLVWIDHHHMKAGDPSWDKTIRTAIQTADVGVFVMTETALASDICGSECLLLRELNKPIYVLRLQACAPEHIWLYIKQIHYADFTQDFDDGMSAFLSALAGETGATLPQAFSAHITGKETMRLHLPYLNNPLRGRDADIHAIQHMLGGHVMQIIGVGGWGKSRISAEIALAYPHGTVWHRCSPISQSYEVVDLLRKHLSLPDDTPADAVLASLNHTSPLIVIDNAEDVALDGETRQGYVHLLTRIASHDVPILLTSRRVWDEFKPRKHYAPAQLDLATASALAQDFALSQDLPMSKDKAENLAKAARLHPRLIEFAVGQLHDTPYDTLMARLTALSHQDIQEAIAEIITKTLEQMHAEATYGDHAYALIHNMTWLQDSFSLDAIEALKPKMINHRDMLIDTLAVLRRYQFLRYDPGADRYSLATLVREALGMPQNPDLFGRYADFYITRARQIFRELPPEDWDDHAHDLPNIRAVGALLQERVTGDNIKDLARARWFAKNTIRYVSRRIEARAVAWTEMGLQAVCKIPASSSREKHNLRRDESFFLNSLGYVWSILGDVKKSFDYYDQALAINHKIGDRGGEALTLTNIGYMWAMQGDYHKALSYYDQALATRQQLKDQHGLAMILNNIGSAWSGLGEHDKALQFHDQVLTIRREEGDKWSEATALTNIGRAWGFLGDHDKALAYLHQALPLRQLVKDKRGEASTWYSIARVHEARGDVAEAIGAAENAIRATYPQDPSLKLYQEMRERLMQINQ